MNRKTSLAKRGTPAFPRMAARFWGVRGGRATSPGSRWRTPSATIGRQPIPVPCWRPSSPTGSCKACNNDAGTYFDGQAHRQERLRQLLSGHGDRPETVTFAVDGFPTRVEMRTAGRTGMLFTVISQINNPAAVELAIEHMRGLSETRNTDFRFTVTPQVRFHPDRARLAWIRAAYLAAFALFGWTYILQPALQPIRDQLKNPSTPGLPPLSMYNPDGDPGRREIWIIKQPAEHQSLLVVAGQHGVFLPLPKDPRSLNELARSLGASEDGPVSYSFTGDMFPWPSKPEYVLDPPPVTDHP